jgi:DNA-binding LytR/AlgR family response regulator
MRVHRNAIVNLDCVKTFTSGSDGVIILQNNVEVNVSREKRRRLREILGTGNE